jgi:hypothetical protein
MTRRNSGNKVFSQPLITPVYPETPLNAKVE